MSQRSLGLNEFIHVFYLASHTHNKPLHYLLYFSVFNICKHTSLHKCVGAEGGEGWLKDVYAPVSSLMNKTQKMKSKSQNTQKKKKIRFQPTLLPLLTSGLVHLFLIFSAIS